MAPLSQPPQQWSQKEPDVHDQVNKGQVEAALQVLELSQQDWMQTIRPVCMRFVEVYQLDIHHGSEETGKGRPDRAARELRDHDEYGKRLQWVESQGEKPHYVDNALKALLRACRTNKRKQTSAEPTGRPSPAAPVTKTKRPLHPHSDDENDENDNPQDMNPPSNRRFAHATLPSQHFRMDGRAPPPGLSLAGSYDSDNVQHQFNPRYAYNNGSRYTTVHSPPAPMPAQGRMMGYGAPPLSQPYLMNAYMDRGMTPNPHSYTQTPLYPPATQSSGHFMSPARQSSYDFTHGPSHPPTQQHAPMQMYHGFPSGQSPQSQEDDMARLKIAVRDGRNGTDNFGTLNVRMSDIMPRGSSMPQLQTLNSLLKKRWPGLRSVHFRLRQEDVQVQVCVDSDLYDLAEAILGSSIKLKLELFVPSFNEDLDTISMGLSRLPSQDRESMPRQSIEEVHPSPRNSPATFIKQEEVISSVESSRRIEEEEDREETPSKRRRMERRPGGTNKEDAIIPNSVTPRPQAGPAPMDLTPDEFQVVTSVPLPPPSAQPRALSSDTTQATDRDSSAAQVTTKDARESTTPVPVSPPLAQPRALTSTSAEDEESNQGTDRLQSDGDYMEGDDTSVRGETETDIPRLREVAGTRSQQGAIYLLDDSEAEVTTRSSPSVIETSHGFVKDKSLRIVRDATQTNLYQNEGIVNELQSPEDQKISSAYYPKFYGATRPPSDLLSWERSKADMADVLRQIEKDGVKVEEDSVWSSDAYEEWRARASNTSLGTAPNQWADDQKASAAKATFVPQSYLHFDQEMLRALFQLLPGLKSQKDNFKVGYSVEFPGLLFKPTCVQVFVAGALVLNLIGLKPWQGKSPLSDEAMKTYAIALLGSKPGTGKTTIGSLLYNILRMIAINDQVIEVSRAREDGYHLEEGEAGTCTAVSCGDFKMPICCGCSTDTILGQPRKHFSGAMFVTTIPTLLPETFNEMMKILDVKNKENNVFDAPLVLLYQAPSEENGEYDGVNPTRYTRSKEQIQAMSQEPDANLNNWLVFSSTATCWDNYVTDRGLDKVRAMAILVDEYHEEEGPDNIFHAGIRERLCYHVEQGWEPPAIIPATGTPSRFGPSSYRGLSSIFLVRVLLDNNWGFWSTKFNLDGYKDSEKLTYDDDQWELTGAEKAATIREELTTVKRAASKWKAWVALGRKAEACFAEDAFIKFLLPAGLDRVMKAFNKKQEAAAGLRETALTRAGALAFFIQIAYSPGNDFRGDPVMLVPRFKFFTVSKPMDPKWKKVAENKAFAAGTRNLAFEDITRYTVYPALATLNEGPWNADTVRKLWTNPNNEILRNLRKLVASDCLADATAKLLIGKAKNLDYRGYRQGALAFYEKNINGYVLYQWLKSEAFRRKYCSDMTGDLEVRIVDVHQTVRQRRNIAREHNESNNPRILLGGMSVMSLGLNLQHSEEGLWLERGTDPGKREQSIRRFVRNKAYALEGQVGFQLHRTDWEPDDHKKNLLEGRQEDAEKWDLKFTEQYDLRQAQNVNDQRREVIEVSDSDMTEGEVAN